MSNSGNRRRERLRWPARARSKMIGLGSLLCAGLAIGLTGCGNQPFVASNAVEQQAAPGTFTIPAKVDIMLAEDDMGSMNEAYSQVSSQMPALLSQLQSSGWDYHFATVPLTTPRKITAVIGSIYDPNWGSQWSPPFPGATMATTETITPADFATPAEYASNPNGFLTGCDGCFSDASNGTENGLSNIVSELYNDNAGTGFIRPDAMLMVLVISNGEDTSQVHMCPMDPDFPNQDIVPCEQAGYPECASLSDAESDPTCGTYNLSMQYYQQLLEKMKSTPGMVRFYSAVSNESTYPNTCLGGYAWQGTRYQEMAAALGGASFDICGGGSITQALTSMSSSLQGVRIGMKTEYLPISQPADPSTIVVTRNDGYVIPQDPDNGWSYSGTPCEISASQPYCYIIDYPVPMDQFTGYAVQLNGSSQLTGSQSATVAYTPLGLQNSD